MASPHPSQSTQFKLLRERRFAPFFWTQFFGAFNDNVFKNAFLLWVTFGLTSSMSLDLHLINNLAAGLFILPFFLFSAFAGQLADKYEKSILIRKVKLAEIFIMMMAVVGFYLQSIPLLLIILFLMGAQSAFFGPVKYSIIPQHVNREELVGGNALVESGTFVAILLGTVLAGFLSKTVHSSLWISIAVVVIALLGWWNSRRIPEAPAAQPSLTLSFNPWKETFRTLRFAKENHTIYLAIMGISWFWFLGAAYLTQLPAYVKDVLFGDQTVVTLLLAVFSIGIAIGSLFCEKFSGHKIEPGLVPLGSIGLSVFGLDLYLTNHIQREILDVSAFVATPGNYRVIIDFIAIGIFGGFYIVPLYAMVQERSAPEHRSRIIAAINIFNALYMVLSAVAGIFFLGVLSFSIPEFFLVLALLNTAFAGYMYSVAPEFPSRFLIWIKWREE